MKRKSIISILIIIQVSTFATGPSHLEIKIRPVAILNQDMLLCKTYYQIDEEGAGPIVEARFGLLMISPAGEFFQTEIFSYERDYYGIYGCDSIYDNYYEIFMNDVISQNEKRFLQKIINIENLSYGMDKYYFDEMYSYQGFLNKYSVKKGFIQRTINNYCSLTAKPNKMNVFFNYNNIIMIRNIKDESFYDEPGSGSGFNVPFWWGKSAVEFEAWNIDGVIIATKD